MIRRQTLKILLIFCTWVQTPPLIRLNKVSRERESPNWRRRRILRASPVCSRFHLFLLFHAEKSNNASRVQPRSQVFILNKFWTNKNNRLCLQQLLGWMAGDNTIGSFEEHKLDIFVSKILCLHLLRKKCCKLDRKIWFFHAAVATRTYWKTAVRGSSDGRRPFPSATKDTSARRLP